MMVRAAPFLSNDPGAVELQALPRGLLNTRGEWCLPLGVSQVRPLRLLAQLVLGLMAALLAFSLFTLLAEARSGSGVWSKVILAGVLGTAWSSMAWRMFRALNQSGTVTLRWGGLPPFKPARANAPLIDLPGWSFPGAQQAVSVQVVFDLGAWLLIKMVPVDGKAASASVWSWLDTRVFFRDGQRHQLRALLFSRHANLVGAPPAGGGVDRATVASSGNRQTQRPNLLSPLNHPSRHAEHDAARRPPAGKQGRAVPERAFADTLIEDRRERE